MRPSSSSPPNLRNGLKWRDGRPRWEPSPASRAVGLRGVDLRTASGDWMTRGEAIATADDRHAWAQTIREARLGGSKGEAARHDLGEALSGLSDALTAEERHKRAMLADLLELAQAIVAERAPLEVSAGGFAPRTVAAMIEGYFADVERGLVELAPGSVQQYRSRAKRLRARFGDRRVDELHRGDMREWYVELRRETSPSTANLVLSVTGALFKWAAYQSPPWREGNPCSELGRSEAPGRLVYWEAAEVDPFAAWCDANGFVDVADGMIAGIWTAARPVDLCLADLEDLAGDTWSYVPQKTSRKTGLEAHPGIIAAVRARIERRAAEAAASNVTPIGGTPFLVNPGYKLRGHRHTRPTLWYRFNQAKAAALLAGAVPETMAEKRPQDWRDTGVTWLWEAIGPERIPGWTGHSPKDVARILRRHYVSHRAAYARESAAMLEAYLKRMGEPA